MVLMGENDIVISTPVTLVRGTGPFSNFTPFPHRIVAFSLSSLVSWLYLVSHGRGYCHGSPAQI